jgi:hypothetical protein
MATPKQTAANRMNAQKSSGPRTSAGKAASRFNALKHGIFAIHQIMFDETPEDLAELAAEYHEHYNPADAHERSLVDTLVANEWRIRRMRRVEAGLWEHASNLFIVKNLDTTTTCTSAEAFATDSATFERLQRVVSSCERDYHRAHKELVVARGHALRSSQPETDPEPQPAEPAHTPQPEPENVGQAPSYDNMPANPEPPSQKPAPPPQQPKPSSANLASFRQNPKTPAPAVPQPATAPPFAGPNAPAEAQPPASDPHPNPPEAA